MIEQFLVWKPARGGVYSVHGGDDCLTEERSHLARHNGPFMGLPATGKSIEVNGLGGDWVTARFHAVGVQDGPLPNPAGRLTII